MQASVEQQNLILQIQYLDDEIMQANTKLKSLPEVEQLAHIEKRITAAIEELATVNAEADAIALELRRGEVDVETVTDRIKKDEIRLTAGTASPKELEQTQHEIETLKKRQIALEEIELEIMMRSEAVQERLKVLNTDLASLEVLKSEINGRMTTATTEINLIILAKQKSKADLIPSIEKPLMDLYLKISGSSNGVGAASLVGNKCNGCHLAINAVEMDRIKGLAADELLRCEECRRILVRI